MKFRRLYSASDDPYAGLEFEPRTSRIVNPDGSVIFEAKDVMVPAGWSQVATDVLAQKYCRKAGVPSATVRVQETGRARVAVALGSRPSDATFGAGARLRARSSIVWPAAGPIGAGRTATSTAKTTRASTSMRCAAMLARQIGAPNSPQWFNTGLHWAYGISGPAQGHYYVDPKTGEAVRSTSAFERPQVSACFILSIDDDLVNEGGIFDGLRSRSTHLQRRLAVRAPISRRFAAKAKSLPAAVRRAG